MESEIPPPAPETYPEKITAVIRTVAETALERNGGYFSLGQVLAELKSRSIPVKGAEVRSTLKRLFHTDPLTPAENCLAIGSAKRPLFNANDPVVSHPAAGQPDNAPSPPGGRSDWTIDRTQLNVKGKAAPKPPCP